MAAFPPEFLTAKFKYHTHRIFFPNTATLIIDIVELNIPTGVPLVYEFDCNINPLKHYYLAGMTFWHNSAS